MRSNGDARANRWPCSRVAFARLGRLSMLVVVGIGLVSIHRRLWAQEGEKDLPKFEVAVVKYHPPNTEPVHSLSAQNGRLTAINQTLRDLIRSAYSLRDDQVVGGPKWISDVRYDVVAKASDNVNARDLWLMVQPLLVEQFKLTYHRESRNRTIYWLVVGKKGPKMKQSTASVNGMRMGKGVMTCTKMPMSLFARVLTGYVQTEVVDKTGLTADFDFTFEWMSDDGKSGTEPGPSLFTALNEQLGLQLKSAKGTIQLFVIDSAERPSAN